MRIIISGYTDRPSRLHKFLREEIRKKSQIENFTIDPEDGSVQSANRFQHRRQRGSLRPARGQRPCCSTLCLYSQCVYIYQTNTVNVGGPKFTCALLPQHQTWRRTACARLAASGYHTFSPPPRSGYQYCPIRVLLTAPIMPSSQST